MSPLRHMETTGDEPFELLEPLGRGGFAHTYRARVVDEDLREEFGAEEVALKIPLDKKKERVLKREVEMGASLHLRLKDLQSQNLVRYLGFDFFRGQLVMVMEFIEQGSLRRVLGDIGRQKRMPIDDAVCIAEGILSGLAIIHQEHIFHRDIKPENILMQGRTPKIADLGIARMLESNELASTTTGTIFYMSPEILSPEGASFTSDIWSLGVTLYEMVTGKVPFGSMQTDVGTMTDLIRRAEPVPACELCPEVPRALSDIIARAMCKRPSERYSSAVEMRETLKHFRERTEGGVEQELAAMRGLMGGADMGSNVEERFEALVKKYPRDPRPYQYLGEFYNRCVRYQDAIATFQKGIEVDPANALLHWDVGLAYQRMGQRADAARSLEKAMALGLDASLQRHATALLKVLRRS